MSSNPSTIERLATIEQNLRLHGIEFATGQLDQFLAASDVSDEVVLDKVLNIRLQILIGQGKFETLEEALVGVEAISPETNIRCLMSQGILANTKEDYQSSLIYFLDAESKAKKIEDPLLLAQVQINIGTVYAGLHHYQEGLDRYAQVLDRDSSILSQSTRAALLHNLGNLNYALGDIEASIRCLAASIDLGSDSLVDRSRLLLQRSRLAIDTSPIFDSPEMKEDHDLYPIYLYCQSFVEAKEKRLATLESVRGLAHDGNDFTTELDALGQIIDIHKEGANWELAFSVVEKMRAVEASLLSKQQAAKLAEQAARYDLAEKEKSIVVLKKEKALQDEIVKRNEMLEVANEELRQFAYVVSHDLKEPLRMIGAYTQIVEAGVKDGGDNDEYFGYIKGGVARLNVLLDGLSNYSTLKSLQDQNGIQSLNTIIETASENLDILIGETNTSINLLNDVEVNGSKALLVLLFQNLIQNAIKFRKPDNAPEIQITASKDSERTTIQVADNGIGIAEDQRDRIFIIFQRLSRNHSDGSGMGLAICRKIVQLHEGRIYVKGPSENGGTTFCIELPN